ncbi:glycosyltransferase [Streptomyces sp. NPDC017056]|uniref:glycosyltransferase n=1 Tax=Streptomyces sp. NPDC017056 TaxID=3364973 RepID=UPI0037AEEB98
MRVLVTVTGSAGHANSMLPIARALAAAGHEILVVTTEQLAPRFAGEFPGVRPLLPGLLEKFAPVLEILRSGGEPPPELLAQFADIAGQMAWVDTAPHVTTAVRAVLPVAKEFGPDLIVRDGAELAACLVAEALGVPFVSAPSGDGNVLDPVRVLGPLNERRAEAGLPPQQDPQSIYRHGRIDCVPAAYSFAAFEVPPAFCYRQPVATGGGLPADIADRLAGRPLVLATVGSEFAITEEAMDAGLGVTDAHGPTPAEAVRAIASALAGIDCLAVLSTGGLALDGFAAADNLLVRDWVDQPALLRHAELFVTHGGYNGIREAMAEGVPMVVVPQDGEQEHNGRRLHDFGIGEPAATPGAEAIAAACRGVLADTRYRERAAAVRGAMRALPGTAELVAHLESLGAG